MDIDIFEQLETIAKSDSNEERILLKQFQKKDSFKEIGTMTQKIIEMEKDEEVLSTEDKKMSKELTRLENEFSREVAESWISLRRFFAALTPKSPRVGFK